MAARELFLFPGGTLQIEKSMMLYRLYFGQKEEIPIVMALIKTDDGNILFDTGMDPEGLTDPQRAWGEMATSVIAFQEKDEIRHQIQQLNLAPGDIQYVVTSHLHWDHGGGLRFFRDSIIITQKSEYRFALYPDTFVARIYNRRHFDHPLRYKLVEGDTQIVPGVHVIHTPGHTPGHQSMIVKLPEKGTVILAGDAVFTQENMEKDIPSPNAWSPALAMDSMHRLRSLAQYGDGLLIPGHDPQLWKVFGHWPKSFQ